MTDIDFSPDQRRALEIIEAWIDDPLELRFTMGGLAGTGKTTLIKTIIADRECAVVAFTGKAAHVLRQKGVQIAQTLHSLIYQPATVCSDCGFSPEYCDEKNARKLKIASIHRHVPSPQQLCPRTGTKTRFRRVPAIPYSLVIVDEASMLNRRLMEDLEQYGCKVLYVGDHGQLEPIGDDPRLMADPQIRLEQIHRQAAGSPILRFAHAVRKGELPHTVDAPEVDVDDGVTVRYGVPGDIERFDAVLCGFNKTRVAVNAKVRARRGFSGLRPNVGERVICLRNDGDLGIFNGMQANVIDVGDETISIEDDGGTKFEGLPVLWEQFGALRTLDLQRGYAQFDFGYALTVHKSQGSEWPRVCVLEQIAPSWSASRWRYTAATRASQELVWCLSAR